MSVPAEVIGQVYGDNFLKTLFNRLPKTALLNPDDHVLTVEWAGQASHEVKCIVEYVNISDATVQEEIPIEEMNTVIEGYKSGLKVRSFFHPKDAIDTLEITPSSPKVTQPALYRIIESGLRTDGEVTRITVVQHDDYIEMRPTANDPYMYTLGLPEAVNLELYYRVYFIVEYQISREVTEGQLFYGRPGAAGGVSTDMDLVYPSLGLDPDDESKWLTFRFDCSQAINTYSWGAVGHRFRFDYVQDVSSENAIMYVRSMKYEIYTLQEID
jgi:hypothetical protein